MKNIINRVILILPAIILQIGWYLLLFTMFQKYIPIITTVLSILAFLFVLYIITKREESTYKILWLLIILELPVLGAWLYLFFGNKKSTLPLYKKIIKSKKKLKSIPLDCNVLEEIKDQNIRLYQTFRYIHQRTSFPLVKNESTKYFPMGEDMFQDMIIELKKAQKFIFLEYFILDEGVFLNTIVEILAEKVKQGVDVKILFDDLGSISTYTHKNIKKLQDKGIECIPFNPFVFIKASLNNRDHRKIMIIDNQVCYSGGINIADEYINEEVRYGVWKDIGFKMTGMAVQSYTYMFIEFWNALSFHKVDEKMLLTDKNFGEEDGYSLSYYDAPYYKDSISNNLYIEFLSQATKKVWFYTPYLMLGDDLTDAFVLAVHRGVDVRIIMPGIPDKKIINRISKSYYKVLMDAGVKIYEYTPGFVHAKACIVDDDICTIGTVNLDYRSLFLHFENNTIFYKASLIESVKQDFIHTMSESHLVENSELNRKFIYNLIDAILKIFAPLC